MERVENGEGRDRIAPGVPDGVTDELIEDANNKKLTELAGLFDPPVSTSMCANVEQKRERLRCGMKKARGTMYDLSYMADLMSELKISDANNREEIISLFVTLKEALCRLSKEDSRIPEQLGKEDITKEYLTKIENFKTSLTQGECRIVIAGQVSSGKSSLLNLFLGGDVLPSQTLSCTATICELAYGEERTAQIVYANGKIVDIPFEDKDRYIYKESERDKKFDHEVVRLYLPVPFLKSGIILVDTPGVGEKMLGDLLLEYVNKTEVFGFIFVIKCNDSGGVLQRFKNMLRKLANIRDSQGQCKFHSKSVIFVANFWDLVPANEKDATKQTIEAALMKEPFMKDFDPEEQMFYMNSLFSLFTWQVGLISEDYESLMKGVEKIFPLGHNRKLSIAYGFLEVILLRILHITKVYLNKARQSYESLGKKETKLRNKLSTCVNDLHFVKVDLTKAIDQKRADLIKKMSDYLQSENAMTAITFWPSCELPKEEYGDNWALIEEKIENAIDKKISTVLQNWEVEEKHFCMAEDRLNQDIGYKIGCIKSKVLEVEKELRNIAIEPENIDDILSLTPKLKIHDQQPEITRKFERRYSVAFARDSEAASFVDRLSPTKLFKIKDRKKEIEEQSAKYFANIPEYMKGKAHTALKLLQATENLKQLVDDNINPVRDSIVASITNLYQEIKANEDLIRSVFTDGRGQNQIIKLYQPHEYEFSRVFDLALSFKYKTLHEYEYPMGSFKEARNSFKRSPSFFSIVPTSLFANIVNLSIPEVTAFPSGTKGRHPSGSIEFKNISIKYFKAQFEGGASLEPRHQFFMAQNLRNVSRHKCDLIPLFLGLHETSPGEDPAFVFEGSLISARSRFLEAERKSVSHVTLKQQMKRFLDQLGEALQFLHLKKFVHLELTMDGVLVDADRDFRVMLSNILEPHDVPYPEDLSLQLANYIYMAPETFPVKQRDCTLSNTSDAKIDRRYTSAADMYALGLLMLELCSKKDIFDDLKCNKSILQFMELTDPGEYLLGLAEKTESHPLDFQLVSKCLKKTAGERCNIYQWNDDWKNISEKW